MNSSYPANGSIISGSGASNRSYPPTNQQNMIAYPNIYPPQSLNYNHIQPGGQAIISPPGYLQKYPPHSNNYASTSSAPTSQPSYSYPNAAQAALPNQAHHDSHDQSKHQSTSDPFSAPAPTPAPSTPVSTTLAPMQVLFQDMYNETRNQIQREVTRVHAHYERLLSEERVHNAAELQKADVRAATAGGELQRLLSLYQSLQTENAKLAGEVDELREEGKMARRKAGKEKEELEKRNFVLEKVVKSQWEEMNKVRDEWSVGQAVRVKLYGENQRLVRELDEVREKLSKIEQSFDQKVRTEFDVRLARVFADEQRRRSKHDVKSEHILSQLVKTENTMKIEDE